MTFNGDGESITVCFEDAFATEAGFPLGECEGTYVFKFQQKAYRYDKAEYLCIYIGEKEFLLRNVFQETNENMISVMSPVAENETLQFVKSNTQDWVFACMYQWEKYTVKRKVINRILNGYL